MANHLRVKLRGGLGNQLHIFIAAWLIGMETGKSLLLDGRFISWAGSNADRKIEIHKFELPNVVDKENKYLASVISPKQATLIRTGTLKAIDLLSTFRKQSTGPTDLWENFEEIKNYACLNSKLEGHFLDLRWLVKAFEAGFPEYLNILSKYNRSEDIRIQNLEECAIHVRLTDFLDSRNNFVQLSESYYLNAVELMRKRGFTQFTIYTDDVRNLREKFPKLMELENVHIASSILSTVESFYLMHKSRAIITANSTFSTLAAMFIWRRGGDVVAPNMRNLNDKPEDYWMPSEWMILNFNSGILN
jgi:hypothetical protein